MLVVVLTETDDVDVGTTVYVALPRTVVEPPEFVSVSCGPPDADTIVTAPEVPKLVVVLTATDAVRLPVAEVTVKVKPLTTVGVPVGARVSGVPLTDTIVIGWPKLFQLVVVEGAAAVA
jgi:hypothetical protein